MIAIRRLAKRFSKQTLSEVKPAPLSETVDHTVEEDVAGPPQKAFQNHSPSLSPSPSQTVSSPASSSEDEDSEEEEDRNNRMERKVCVRRRLRVAASRGELPVERVPSAEKRKYSQYKCSVEGCSSASSSDDEVKEAFESSLPSDHTPGSQRPIRVPPSGCRKRVPKYFAQMASPGSIERPRLDFNKMQSKRFLMVHKPVVLRHNYHPHTFSGMCPPLELSLDFTSHSFQPVPTQT